MPIHTDRHTEALLAHYRAQRTTTRAIQTPSDTKTGQAIHTTKDRVEISISANLTTEAANGILFDSVVEQINKALQEGGINLKVEDGEKMDLSPQGTARRIVDFATSFFDTFRQHHAHELSLIHI